MVTSSTIKRFRAVVVALAITFLANYAISYAAKSGTPNNPDNPRPRVELADRSGTPNNPDNPRP